ncbi:hypothetical protein EJB05_31521 [Eragrostis curvula]|uniref:DUF674 domain-containing protein n=1 Tax=Eragrostis curvula TaxID=38414 RepID=A0A5J9UF28_9POAL|nr:hypothetical protein EJB05_31521 [Eragrostis curvula]
MTTTSIPITSPAAATAAAARTLSMKLLINTKTQRVLFAEAGKDVVDFLFSLLALPIATAAKLIGPESAASCSVGNLYASVDKLDSTYVLPGAAKDALLQPTIASAAMTNGSSLLRLPEVSPPQTVQPKNLYKCRYALSNCYLYVAGVSGTKCPSCGSQMMTAMYYTGQTVQNTADATGGAKGGLVQGVVTYTVTDDLAVTPMSTISGITLLNTFGVRDLSDLQEKTVQIGYEEGVEIRKASLHSQTVLTDVFLRKKAPGDACVADTKLEKDD